MSKNPKLKNPYNSDLIAHFTPFHETLTELSNSADILETEGGMTWSFEYIHGRSHTAKIDNEYLHKRADFDNPTDIDAYTHSFAELIWLTIGNPNYNYFEMDCEFETMEEYVSKRNKIISNYYDQASEIISLYKTSSSDKCFISFSRKEGLWIKFNSVVLQGRNGIIHSAFWSVD